MLMKKICNHYSFEDINLFVDNELSENKTAEVARHCESCPICSGLVTKITLMDSLFNDHVVQQTQTIRPDIVPNRIRQTIAENGKTVFGNTFGLFSKNIYLKLSGITAILIIGLAMFNGTVLGPSSPSAIVNYVDTELPSVMIIETQKQKHTIIWFSET